MKPDFQYAKIGRATADRLFERLANGQDTFVIGPRGVGKRFLVDLVYRRYMQSPSPFVAMAAFPMGRLLACEEDVVEKLSESLGLSPATRTIEAWAAAVRALAASAHPVRLFITNLDGIAKRLIHRLLTAMQGLAADGLLVTLATGEGAVIDLLDEGHTSSWASLSLFFVHLHDGRGFRGFLTKCLRQAGLWLPRPLSEAKSVVSGCFEQTGGDITLARAILWSITHPLNLHLARSSGQPYALTLEDVSNPPSGIHAVSAVGIMPFQQAGNCILAAACEADSALSKAALPALDDLRKLLGGGTVTVVERPHLTELAGLTRRVDGRLEWFCAYARQFAHDYFHPRRLGDYYACAHRWQEAYALYDTVPAEAKCRPLSGDDVPMLMRLMDGLAVHFHRQISDATQDALQRKEAVNPLDTLRSELRKALRHLLGFAEEQISGWSLDWRCVWVCTNSGCGTQVLPETVRLTWEALRLQETLLDAEVSGYKNGYHWVLCRNGAQQAIDAVLIDGSDDPLRDDPARRGAVFRLLQAYQRARERYAATEDLREQLRFSITESRILKTFWKLTAASASGPQRMLPYIAGPLRECLPSVDRLVFCELRGMGEDSVQVLPVYDTKQPQECDFQPIHIPIEILQDSDEGTAVPFTKAQANEWWRGRPFVSFERGGFLITDREYKGILLVEGAAHQPITSGIIKFIRRLAETLRPFWSQAQRLKVLHESINAFPNPSLILDNRGRIIYANLPAVVNLELLKVRMQPGWQATPLRPLDTWEIYSALRPAADTESKECHDVTPKMAGVWIRECHPLRDESGVIIGYVLTFRDRAFLYDSFRLISELENASDERSALEIIGKRVETLLRTSNVKVRLYVIDKKNRQRLAGYKSFGLRADHQSFFEAGKVDYPHTDKEAWKCLDDSRPIAFKLDVKEPLGAEGSTRRGLKYYYIHPSNKSEILEKEPGDVSIDFPLISGKVKLGKLTLNFTAQDAEELPPEIPLQMGALSFVLSDLLDHVSQNEIRQQQILANTAEQALAETAHNLLSQISGFAPLIFRYQLLEDKLPALKSVNDDLEKFFEHARDSMRRIKDRAGEVHLVRKELHLSDAIEHALQTVFGEDGPWEFPWDHGTSTAGYWDALHWENAIIEIAHNSKDFARPGLPLSVTVTLSLLPGEDGKPAQLEIHYMDNGRGVPGHLKPIIFEGRSYREEIGKPGKGLGLKYARRVIEAHGGTIHEIGPHGSGAHFVIVVPIITTPPPNDSP